MSANSNALLLLSPADNCLVACQCLRKNDVVLVDGVAMSLPQDVPLGYKVARSDLKIGVAVCRYGAQIGSTTSPVFKGELLHTHNLKSNYLPTHSLGTSTDS
jgi:hypothetical protein